MYYLIFAIATFCCVSLATIAVSLRITEGASMRVNDGFGAPWEDASENDWDTKIDDTKEIEIALERLHPAPACEAEDVSSSIDAK